MRRVRCWIVALFVALGGLGTARPVAAQASWRIQTVWVDDAVLGAVVGLEVRQPIGAVPPQPVDGPRILATRDWMVTGMVGVGLNFNGPGTRDMEGLLNGHLGILRRLGGDLEPRVGVVLFGYAPAGATGLAGRAEVMDVAVLTAGMSFDGGLMVGVEVVGRFLMDIVE